MDLIHYNHQYRSFVSVQYKRMSKEENGDKVTLGFRPTDKQFRKELLRMKAFAAKHQKLQSTDPNDYRLGGEAFYFKICGSIILQPESTRPLAGMHVPLSLMESLLQADSIKGPKGGMRITWDNVGRYIGNDLFVQLVQDGWIGTHLGQEAELSEIIQRSLEADHSAIIAVQHAELDETQDEPEVADHDELDYSI